LGRRRLSGKGPLAGSDRVPWPSVPTDNDKEIDMKRVFAVMASFLLSTSICAQVVISPGGSGVTVGGQIVITNNDPSTGEYKLLMGDTVLASGLVDPNGGQVTLNVPVDESLVGRTITVKVCTSQNCYMHSYTIHSTPPPYARGVRGTRAMSARPAAGRRLLRS